MVRRRFPPMLGLTAVLGGATACEQTPPAPESPDPIADVMTADTKPAEVPAEPPATPPPSTPARPAPLPRELTNAVRMIGQRRFDEARTFAVNYAAQHPDDGRASFMIALAYHKAGNHGPAVEHFERALTLNPDYHATHHFYGECLFLLGELDASRAQHAAHHAVAPREPDALYGLGLVDLEESKLNDAEERFRAALALFDAMQTADPRQYRGRLQNVAECHARLADIHFARDAYELARDELIESTTIYPRNISAFYALSLVHRRLGEDAQADAALARYEAAKAAMTGSNR